MTGLTINLSNLGGLFTPGSEVDDVIGPLVFRPIPGQPKEIVGDRMVYGSDWYMTQLTELSGEYLSEASKYLGRIECERGVPGLRNRVLGLNALRLYGLDPQPKDGKETNWDRLTAYYDSKGIKTPNWMQKITPPRPPDRC
jgi:hypothetical protein